MQNNTPNTHDYAADLVRELIKEKRSERRWKNIRFFLGLILVILIFLVVMGGSNSPTMIGTGDEKGYVSLIRLDGMIAPDQAFSAVEVAPLLKDAFSDTQAKGVILDINSGGGTPVQAAIMHDMIVKLKNKYHKKVIVVGEDLLASGAYYVAVGADKIYVNLPLKTELKLNLTQGVTPISHDIYFLHTTILWICIAIGIAVFGVMFYAIIYHRKSRQSKPARFHEHLWLEITWTIIPLIILIAMAIPATLVLKNMSNNDSAEITIKITGYQWKWKYDYLEQDIHFFSNLATSPAEIYQNAPKKPGYLREVDHPLVLPIHKKIRFLMTSNDVIHAWWVPDFAVQRDAIPGFINEAWARIDKPGVYYGQCAKLCGMNHAFMPIVVMAVTEKEFADWVLQQKNGIAAPKTTPTIAIVTTAKAATAPSPQPPPANQLGEKIYLTTCAVCHQPDGKGMPPTFPALNGSKIVTGDKEKHIDTVLNGRPGTAMQAFKEQLTDEELAAVITYERNAWGNHTGDIIKPSDIQARRGK